MVNEMEETRANPKQIFVTGGVVSSLGKGLTASSLGMLLRARGLSVVMQKLDPYINVDPGTMNPFQHGEVFVTEDGTETDLDIGHYERFLDVNLSGDANVTTGQVYQAVLQRERRGGYLGDTVQVIPHVTGEIMRRLRAQAGEPALPPADGAADSNADEPDGPPDVIITEIGGTVGDIESTPFLEAARQTRRELGHDNSMFIHVSLLPYLPSAGELKTKPTQHSVANLRSLGIQPDALILRSWMPVPDSVKRKVALMCDVESEAVLVCEDASSIYQVPMELHAEGLDDYVVRRLGLEAGEPDLARWDELLGHVEGDDPTVEIALVGKYVDLHDAYLSVSEALRAGGFAAGAQVKIRWVASDDCLTLEDAGHALAGVEGILVPGGFGVRGIEGKVVALQWARENRVPTLGICLGLQCMVIEAAQNLVGLEGATSTEFDPHTKTPLVATMDDQLEAISGTADLGGTMRLGAYPAVLAPGSTVAETYGTEKVSERHRHRFEVNSKYLPALAEKGFHASGKSPDGGLVEFVELERDQHPYYVATQAHPEFKSRPTRPHPLFVGLARAALDHQAGYLY